MEGKKKKEEECDWRGLEDEQSYAHNFLPFRPRPRFPRLLRLPSLLLKVGDTAGASLSW